MTNQPISPQEFQAMLKTGMDVDWAKVLPGRRAAQKAHDEGINVPAIFKKRGLSHVRIRVKDSVINEEKDSKTNRSLLEEITVLVNDCLEADLIPIIAYQAAAFKDNPTSDEVIEEVVKWWKAVAKQFKDYSYKLAYNLIIETTGEVKEHNDRLNLCYKKIMKQVRKIDPYRICIVAPNNISNPEKLEALEVPTPRDYMMVEWHFYAAGAKKDNPKKQWTTGTKEEKALITDKIAIAKAWSETNNIPTWVGAWMANNYNEEDGATRKCDPKNVDLDNFLYDCAPGGGDYTVEEQKVFASFMSRQLQKAGIPYAVNSDTKFFNRDANVWYESIAPVLDAMVKEYKKD